MSKKPSRVLKAPTELVALGGPVTASSLKKEPSSGMASGSRTIIPEKKPKLHTSIPPKPSISKKLSSDITVKKESLFEVEQLYSFASGASSLSHSQADSILKQAARFMESSPSKTDGNFFMSLLLLCNERPELFRSDIVFTAFSSLLHSKPMPSQERRVTPVFAANLLYFAYRRENVWPSELFAFFIEDFLGEKIWVDRPECSLFVFHLMKSLGTRLPPHLEESIRGSVLKKGFRTNNDSIIGYQRCLQNLSSTLLGVEEEIVLTTDWESVGSIIGDSVKEFISRKQTGEAQLQNLLRTMSLTSCFPEVRKIASEKLEFWLQNQKIVKLAQDLLMTVCMNSSGESQMEVESISSLIRLKYASKQKHLSAHFLSCMRQLLISNPGLARRLIVQYVVGLEISPPSQGVKQAPNFALLDAAFSVDGGWATNHVLADFFGEVIISSKEDCLKPLRIALRDIAANVKSSQLSLKAFVDVLLRLSDRVGSDRTLKDRVINYVTDLTCLAQQLCVNELVISAFDNYKLPANSVLGSPTLAKAMEAQSQTKDTIERFQSIVSSIQLSATKWWLSLRPVSDVLGSGLRTLLMMDPMANYTQRDNYPPEPERTSIFKILTHYIPSSEDMFQLIAQSPVAMEHHFNSFQLIEILCGLLARNASLSRNNLPTTIPLSKPELINNLLDQSRYHVDKSYGEYVPLAVTSIYWKAWMVILLSVAVNPKGLGSQFWPRFPTLRYSMEMCMTGCYEFPSAAVASNALKENALQEEKRIAEEERKALEVLGQKLTAATKTMSSLVNQVRCRCCKFKLVYKVIIIKNRLCILIPLVQLADLLIFSFPI